MAIFTRKDIDRQSSSRIEHDQCLTRERSRTRITQDL